MLEAEDATQGRRRIADRPPDLILMDWMLPGISGVEFTRELKADPLTREMLGLERKRDKGRRIDKVVKDPVFREFLGRGDYDRPLQMPSPVNDNVSLEVRVVLYGKGKHLMQARDITRLQQLETVRRDFVANVSHEMRTPLTVIHGYLEAMEETADAGLAGWRPAIRQMVQQSNRMQRIVAYRIGGRELRAGGGRRAFDVAGLDQRG